MRVDIEAALRDREEYIFAERQARFEADDNGVRLLVKLVSKVHCIEYSIREGGSVRRTFKLLRMN